MLFFVNLSFEQSCSRIKIFETSGIYVNCVTISLDQKWLMQDCTITVLYGKVKNYHPFITLM